MFPTVADNYHHLIAFSILLSENKGSHNQLLNMMMTIKLLLFCKEYPKIA